MSTSLKESWRKEKTEKQTAEGMMEGPKGQCKDTHEMEMHRGGALPLSFLPAARWLP